MLEYHMTSRLGMIITSCIKIDKPLMTSIITLRKRRQNLNVFTPKMRFLSIFNVESNIRDPECIIEFI